MAHFSKRGDLVISDEVKLTFTGDMSNVTGNPLFQPAPPISPTEMLMRFKELEFRVTALEARIAALEERQRPEKYNVHSV